MHREGLPIDLPNADRCALYPCLVRLVCRLSITQTDKRYFAIDGGNGKASSLFQTIGGKLTSLRQIDGRVAGAPIALRQCLP